MTPSTLRLKQLAEAATPGPWYDYREQGIFPTLFSYEELSNGQRKLVEYIGHAQKEENRQFIAAANPEAVLGLISRIEKLEAALRFYADIGTYGTAGPGDCTSVDSSDCEPVLIDGWGESYRPGKKAREALKEEA
jgi:hypothetical protein